VHQVGFLYTIISRCTVNKTLKKKKSKFVCHHVSSVSIVTKIESKVHKSQVPFGPGDWTLFGGA